MNFSEKFTNTKHSGYFNIKSEDSGLKSLQPPQGKGLSGAQGEKLKSQENF
jgi:hypothetical protein